MMTDPILFILADLTLCSEDFTIAQPSQRKETYHGVFDWCIF